jgi:hypothetical protein
VIVEENVLPELQNMLEGLYQRTYANWEGGSRDLAVKKRLNPHSRNLGRAYPKPTTEFIKANVEITPNGNIRIRQRSFAAEGGQPHELWYRLDLGTRPVLFTRRSAVFPVRRYRRFRRGKIDPQSHPGFESGSKRKYATIKAGRVRKGIQPVLLSDAIGRELQAELSGRRGDIGGVSGWRVSRRTVSAP